MTKQKCQKKIARAKKIKQNKPDDGIVKKIEPGDEVPDICRKKGYFKEKKYQVVGGLF